MTLPTVTKKILNADYVQVTWSDINSNSSWLILRDARNSKFKILVYSTVRYKQHLNIIKVHSNFEIEVLSITNFNTEENKTEE